VPTRTVTMLVSELLWITAAFLAAVLLVLPNDFTTFLLDDNGIWRIVLVVAGAVVILHFHDLYTDLHVKSGFILLQQLCIVAGILFLLQGLIAYFSPDLRVPIRIMVVGSALAITVIFLWRLLFSEYLLRAVGRDRILLVGSTMLLEEIARQVEDHPEAGSEVVGYVTDGAAKGSGLRGGTVLGGALEIEGIVEKAQPRRIVVAAPEDDNHVPVSGLLEMRFNGQEVEDAADAYERVSGRVCLKALCPRKVIYSGDYSPRAPELFYQTVLNRTLAFVGLVLTLPFLAMVAAAVKLTSRGPVFTRSTRVGMDGQRFVLYKFRCLQGPDAETDVWVPRNDPRVTAVGRFLRLSRGDQLPQLYNVLRGDMAIVGPRPERPEFDNWLVERMPCYRLRQAVRPGVTGWAQINRKNAGPLDAISSLEYDLYYVKNLSLSLDTFILAHTLKAIVVSRGDD